MGVNESPEADKKDDIPPRDHRKVQEASQAGNFVAIKSPNYAQAKEEKNATMKFTWCSLG
jgi:hypothetical protein